MRLVVAKSGAWAAWISVDLEDRIAFSGRGDLRSGALLCGEGPASSLVPSGNPGTTRIRRDEIGGDDLQVMRGRSGGETGLLRFSRQLLREGLLLLRFLLAGERGLISAFTSSRGRVCAVCFSSTWMM